MTPRGSGEIAAPAASLPHRRFPTALAITAAVALTILVGLGVWQLERLKWKEGLLAKIAALHDAPPSPLAQALRAASGGASAEYRRVDFTCLGPARASPMVFRYALRDGRIGWRLMSVCRLALPPYDGIVLDRGLVEGFDGLMAPQPVRFPDPVAVTAILRSPGRASWLDLSAPMQHGAVSQVRAIDRKALVAIAAGGGVSRPVPYLAAVEIETPAPAGVTPAALPQDIPNNHFAYALTWFGLAGALSWVAAGLIRRRLAGP